MVIKRKELSASTVMCLMSSQSVGILSRQVPVITLWKMSKFRLLCLFLLFFAAILNKWTCAEVSEGGWRSPADVSAARRILVNDSPHTADNHSGSSLIRNRDTSHNPKVVFIWGYKSCLHRNLENKRWKEKEWGGNSSFDLHFSV